MGLWTVGDGCHQLHASIVLLNTHARCSIILGRQCSFDEDGINPVHQCNSSKPGKYRINFFVLVNASKGKHFIYHLGMYEGKNACKPHIVEEAWRLPTTKYAAVNANPQVMCNMYLGNWYTAPELLSSLYDVSIVACGTICSNHKGWDSTIMNLA